MRVTTKAVALVLTLTLAGCGGTKQQQTAENATNASQPMQLTLLHINDHHSHLDAENITLQLATGSGKREPVTVERGGFPRVTGAIKAMEKEAVNVIKIHSGDASTGDLYYTLNEGKADADLMNTVCFDTFTLGNHEFDNTDAGVKKFMGFLHAGSCKTAVLSANVRFGPSSPMFATKAPETVLPSVVLERGGQKIGVIGLTVAGKAKNSSRPNSDTTFIDEATAAQAEIDRLQAQGINKIILSTHIGYPADQALVKKLSGVDVVVGGDSHSLLGPAILKDYGISPEGPYPTRSTDKDGKPVCITQAWQYGYVVGETRVSFDAQGELSGCEGTPWVLIGDDFRRDDNSALRPEEIANVHAEIAAGQVLRITTPDPQAAALLAPYKKQKEAMGATVVATSSDNLCLRRVPGSKRDTSRSSLGDVCNSNDRVNGHGGDIQQIVAEAFLQQGKAFFGADLSLQNGGGVRVDLAAGKITVKDVYTVLPFKNTLVQLNATGAEIKAALEDAVEGVVGPTLNTGCYPYAGGLRWWLDLNKPKGSRLSHLEIRTANGAYQPFDLRKTYKVATISFLADGNDSFTALKNITGERRIDVGLDYAEAFLRYIEKLPGEDKVVKPLPVTDYSTQRFVDAP
ncbi:5'-nucleotidase C-terminal domain-containing protein [uncultured Desulfobulbus sp.]|uniref:bifunctional metallophosphatase/5'-nucleotidase n=1 Tax=uncultured Desulfobulbus sp. TaxID=239745 RepID=UPI0029C98DB8|nr:5'-nucleotidase C-terminal domain-containing protein [uncultured Desulfobulbus sp.]